MKRYMEGYDSYQRNENCTEQLAEKLMPNSILEKPWIHISADFITKLSLAQEYNAILVVVDWLTKMVHFIPTTEKTTAEGLAKLFRDNVWKLYGLPKSIISDRRPQFAVGVMKELNQILGIESKLSIVFHPQTDRQTERFVGPYKIKKIVLTNVVELELPSTIRIHSVVNVSRIHRYVGQVERQRREQPAPVIIKGEEE